MTANTKRKLGGREATSARIDGDFALAVGKPDRPPPSGWEWRLLTDLARLESGHTPSRKKPEYWGGDIPWIGIRDATGNHGRTIYETKEYTNEHGIANSAARVLPSNTVCLSRTASVGYVVVMGRPMATSQDFVNWSCSKDLNATFLKYALMAEGDALLRFASGSVHQTIYFPEVKSFYIATPPVSQQRAIAEVLGSLDDKIELNRRMNETLEAMAQAIFRDWFVDFGPTRRKLDGATDALTIMGGLVQDTDRARTLAGLFPTTIGDLGLPEGWGLGSIYETAKVIYGAPFASKQFNDERRGRPLARIRDLPRHQGGVFTEEVHPKEYLIDPGDIVVGMDGEFRAYLWQGEQTLMNQRICCFRPLDAANRAFVYLALQPLLATHEATAIGTTVIHLGKKEIDGFKIPSAGRAVLHEFGEVAEPLIAKIVANGQEYRTLAATRDLLLPRLMSGQIRVRDAEKLIEADE